MRAGTLVRKIVSATVTKGPNGTNVFTLSTDDVDRDGDTIDQRGWNLSEYKQNPTVLWGHDHKSLPMADVPTFAWPAVNCKGRLSGRHARCVPSLINCMIS